jgi:flagellar biosynthetic protein FliQ
MEQGMVIKLAKDAFQVTLMVAGPMLVASLIMGITISILQVVTSIQDMTLTFIPKLFAILVSLAVFGAWMGKISVDFATSLYARVLEIVR